jgi:hypothetical protein
MSTRSSFIIAVATLALGLVGLERGFAWCAPKHFIPESRLEEALRRPIGCIVVAGDSRMVAGYDEAALTSALRVRGRNECVSTIAIGALPIAGVAVAVREFLDRGGRPRVLVLGAAEDTLLRRSSPPDPSEFVGNEAVFLSWSRWNDTDLHYPGFPFESPAAFDRGFRFLLLRSNGIGRYVSLGWQKVQGVQDRVTGQASASNVFGALSDMEARGRAMEQTARKGLARALERSEDERLDPWFSAMEEMINAVGGRLVVVELPMPKYYREGVTHSAEGRRYRAWLAARLERRGNALVDLTSLKGLESEHFADFLHLNAAGARRFSSSLGERLSAIPPGRIGL